MKTNFILTKLIVAVVLLSVSVFLNAQKSTNNLLDEYNTENIYPENESVKITLPSIQPISDACLMMVSNPETASVFSNANRSVICSSRGSNMVSLFAEEMENDIELEEWMLKPFVLENSLYAKNSDYEEEIPLEEWMMDLSLWK